MGRRETFEQPTTPESLREWERRFPGVMDSLGILGGGANIIMQLANPGVGHGVVESPVESGRVFNHPIKRTRTTMTYLAVAMLGTKEEKAAYRKAVNKSHAQVRSTKKSPVQYNAFDPSLQLWVAACLYWGLAENQRIFYGGQDSEAAEALYQLASTLGTTLQVPRHMWPENLRAFETYWQDGLDKLDLHENVRDFLLKLIDLKFLPGPVSALLGPSHRFITTGFLPAEMRKAMGLRWSERHQKRFDKLMNTIGQLNRRIPAPVRQFPTWLMLQDFRYRLRRGKPLV